MSRLHIVINEKTSKTLQLQPTRLILVFLRLTIASSIQLYAYLCMISNVF